MIQITDRLRELVEKWRHEADRYRVKSLGLAESRAFDKARWDAGLFEGYSRCANEVAALIAALSSPYGNYPPNPCPICGLPRWGHQTCLECEKKAVHGPQADARAEGSPDYLSMSPLDPRYSSREAQIARLRDLLDYVRQHAPDPRTEAWLQREIDGVPAAPGAEDATTHELKTWPEYYSAVLEGTKTFEYRRDDRGFKVGDVLHLREWVPSTGYTGREMRRRVAYLLRTDLHNDCVVMALERVASPAPAAGSAERKVWIVYQFNVGWIRGVFQNQADAEAEIGSICATYRSLGRQDFIVQVERIRTQPPSAGVVSSASTERGAHE
jgi:hypothetical protein